MARASLHPALSDMLLEAAQEVHRNPTVFQRRNEFPAALEHDFLISPDASRFYKSGKTFLYKALPFWLAGVVRRVFLAFVPTLIILIPGLRVLPALYRLRMRLRLYRLYRALLALERSGAEAAAPDKLRDSLADRKSTRLNSS